MDANRKCQPGHSSQQCMIYDSRTFEPMALDKDRLLVKATQPGDLAPALFNDRYAATKAVNQTVSMYRTRYKRYIESDEFIIRSVRTVTIRDVPNKWGRIERRESAESDRDGSWLRSDGWGDPGRGGGENLDRRRRSGNRSNAHNPG